MVTAQMNVTFSPSFTACQRGDTVIWVSAVQNGGKMGTNNVGNRELETSAEECNYDVIY